MPTGTPLRRSTRSASRDLTNTPAPIPPRSTRASSRASSRATDGTGPLPSLIGRNSSAYGSPTQIELANALTPSKNASGLFTELAAKRYPTDPHTTSDLDQSYVPVPKKPTTRRKATAVTASRPSPIQEESTDGPRDHPVVVGDYSRFTPIQQHARQGALPPPGQWDRLLSVLTVRKAQIALLLMTVIFAVALPWIPVSQHGGFLDILKDHHHQATSSITGIFRRPEATTTSSQDYARLSRQIYNLQVGQDYLKRRFGGSADIPDSAAKFVKNYEDATSQVNFFSAKLGAMVDVQYSSPTRQPPKLSFFDQIFTGYRTLEPNEHISALLPWQEAGDCWCAPSVRPPGQAKAQLGILMPRDIVPAIITVEHHPQKGLLEPGTTPREMSVWIQIDDKALRDEIADILGTSDPDDHAMPDDYVEIAHFSYVAKPRDGNHIQTFGLRMPLLPYAEKGLSVRKAIVRVDSNHGADYTCLYRVRMHGHVVNSQDALYDEYHKPADSSW